MRSSVIRPKLITTGNDGIAYQDTFWEDLRVNASAIRINPATSKPDIESFQGDTLAIAFDDTDTERVTFQAQMPHGYKLGTPIHPHIHWAPSGTDTGFVRWQFEYTVAKIGEAFPSTSTFTVDSYGSGVAYEHTLTELGEINMTGIDAVSAILVCSLARIGGSDNFSGDAFMLYFDFHYELDSPGSRWEYIK